MPRAIWSGAISFGLVNVAVKAYPAVRDHRIHFRELDENGARVRHEKVSSKTGKPVDEIKLGFETSKGHFVRFTPGEIEEMRPASTRAVEISDFVDLADIDPIFYERTYWLAPGDERAGEAYALLRDAMHDEEKVGIGSVVMRRKQYLAAIRPVGGALALSTMRFADEVVPSSSIDGIPKRAGRREGKELALAQQIIDALSTDWKPERYHDTYTEELRSLIKKRSKGAGASADAEPGAEVESSAKVVDLMEALEGSLSSMKKGSKSRPRSGRASSNSGRRKSA